MPHVDSGAVLEPTDCWNVGLKNNIHIFFSGTLSIVGSTKYGPDMERALTLYTRMSWLWTRTIPSVVCLTALEKNLEER